MSLASLLELWHGTPGSFTTLRAVVRHWQDAALSRKAIERFHEALEEEKQSGRGGGIQIMVSSSGDAEETSEYVTHLWIALPDRLRQETEGGYEHVRVRNGCTEWMYSANLGAIEHEARELLSTQEAAMLVPLSLAPGFDFEIGGEVTIAGRQGMRVNARPRRPTTEMLPVGLAGAGASEYRLVVDSETGLLLTTEALLNDDVFASTEILELELDGVLPPDVFVFTPPEGERIRTEAELRQERFRDSPPTVEEAARMVDFPIFVPRLDWQEPRLWITHLPESERPPITERVVLHYSDDFGPRQFSLQQMRATSEDVPPGFEQVDVGDNQAWLREAEGMLPAQLRILRDGTLIELSAHELETEEVLRIAHSLVPAPTEPPELG